MSSGVQPLSFALLTSASASTSARTTVSWPFSAPMHSGVAPPSFALLTSAPASISARSTASWPF